MATEFFFFVIYINFIQNYGIKKFATLEEEKIKPENKNASLLKWLSGRLIDLTSVQVIVFVQGTVKLTICRSNSH